MGEPLKLPIPASTRFIYPRVQNEVRKNRTAISGISYRGEKAKIVDKICGTENTGTRNRRNHASSGSFSSSAIPLRNSRASFGRNVIFSKINTIAEVVVLFFFSSSFAYIRHLSMG